MTGKRVINARSHAGLARSFVHRSLVLFGWRRCEHSRCVMARMMGCPGQDTRYWKLENVFFEVMCAHCGKNIEFFKDDLKRACPYCDFRAKPV